MNGRAVLLPALLLLLGTAPALARLPEFVGDLGAAERIVFKGQQAFTEQQLRTAVAGNLELIYAGHPRADFGSYLKLINKQLMSGYLHAGYPNALVQTNYDRVRGVIVVTIDEGARYRAGSIDIEGAVTIDADQIRRYLTEWQNPSENQSARKSLAQQTPPNNIPGQDFHRDGPVWRVDQPAPFSEWDRHQIENAIQKRLEQLGYLEAKFRCRVRPAAGGVAKLSIAISDEGQRATLGEIHVSGNDKNSAADIIQLLGLNPGTPLNSEVTAECRRKLRSSGRFLRHDLEIIPPFDDVGPSILKVTVCECPTAPPLDQEFEPLEQTALLAGRWFDNFGQSQEDLSVDIQWTPRSPNAADEDNKKTSQTWTANLILSPSRHEALLRLRCGPSPESTRFDATLIALRDRLIIDSGDARVRCEIPLSECHFNGSLKLRSFAPDDHGKTLQLEYGIGYKSQINAISSAIATVCDPSAVIEGLAKWKGNLHLEDGRLSFANDNTDCRFDAVTGRLLGAKVHWDDIDAGAIKIETGAGLFDAALHKHNQTAATREVFRVDESPLSAAIAFWAGSYRVQLTDQQPDFADQLIRLAGNWRNQERSTAKAVDVKIAGATRNDSFSIPQSDDTYGGLARFYEWTLPTLNQALPPHSWAWTLAREFTFTLMGQTMYRDEAIGAIIKADDAGPLSHLAGAFLFGSLDPTLKVEFARRGQYRLATKHFHNDCEAFLDPETPSGKTLIQIGRRLQTAQPDDLALLLNLLPLEQGFERNVLMNSITQMCAQRNQPAESLMAEILDELWEPLFRPAVQQLLTDYLATELPRSRLQDDDPFEPTEPTFGLRGGLLDGGDELLQLSEPAIPRALRPRNRD